MIYRAGLRGQLGLRMLTREGPIILQLSYKNAYFLRSYTSFDITLMLSPRVKMSIVLTPSDAGDTKEICCCCCAG